MISPSICEATGKRCYDKKAAESARNQRTSRGRYRHNKPAFLRIYHCPHCGSWHLTKQPTSD